MTDEQLYSIISEYIRDNVGIADLEVVQRYQPESGGVSTNMQVFVDKIGDKRYGYPRESDVWDEDTQAMVHTHLQQMESTFQISALQPKGATESITASDLVNDIADLLQTQAAVQHFRNSGLAFIRVTDIRNSAFVDDRERNEKEPSFDFTVQHVRVKISTSPSTSTITADVKRV